jgi:hypothetical protein
VRGLLPATAARRRGETGCPTPGAAVSITQEADFRGERYPLALPRPGAQNLTYCKNATLDAAYAVALVSSRPIARGAAPLLRACGRSQQSGHCLTHPLWHRCAQIERSVVVASVGCHETSGVSFCHRSSGAVAAQSELPSWRPASGRLDNARNSAPLRRGFFFPGTHWPGTSAAGLASL